MIICNNLNYQSPILIEEFYNNDKIHRLYLSKSFFASANKDQYFLKIFHYTPNKALTCEGYIYFYLDTTTCESSFIGAFVKPEYRGQGLSSYLFAAWIKFCLEAGFYHIKTSTKQRKPFLIYQLKTFSFEIEDPTLYGKSNYTINICKKDDDRTKYLHFQLPEDAKRFAKGAVMHGDNYAILDTIDESTIILDDVLLSKPYFLQDEETAYRRSRKIHNEFKK